LLCIGCLYEVVGFLVGALCFKRWMRKVDAVGLGDVHEGHLQGL